MKFSIKDFFSKCDQIHRKLRILSHLLKKSLMQNFNFCAVTVCSGILRDVKPNWDLFRHYWGVFCHSQTYLELCRILACTTVPYSKLWHISSPRQLPKSVEHDIWTSNILGYTGILMHIHPYSKVPKQVRGGLPTLFRKSKKCFDFDKKVLIVSTIGLIFHWKCNFENI